MTTDELIEAAATKIIEELVAMHHSDAFPYPCVDATDPHKTCIDGYVDIRVLARAALSVAAEAMREPTEEMTIEGGIVDIHPSTYMEGAPARTRTKVAKVYRAMFAASPLGALINRRPSGVSPSAPPPPDSGQEP